MNIFGYEDFVDTFKRSSQIGLDLGGISMYFRVSFGVCNFFNFNIFLGFQINEYFQV